MSPAVVGALAGYAIVKLRLSPLTAAAASLVGFFAFGAPIALRGPATAGVIPNPAVFSGLVDGLLNGWARLLTSVPPAGHEGNLLAIPYACGFVGALVAVIVAGRVRRWPLAVLAPAAVLAVSVLMGVDHPASLLLQGGLFGAIAVGWMAVLDNRRRPVLVHRGRSRRLLPAIALLTVAAAAAVGLGPSLPLANDHPRYVLRERIVPPFDPREHASPLVGYRNYVSKSAKETTELSRPA